MCPTRRAALLTMSSWVSIVSNGQDPLGHNKGNKMDGKIGTLTWNDCKDCKHDSSEEKGCDVPNPLDIRIDEVEEIVVCEHFESKWTS